MFEPLLLLIAATFLLAGFIKGVIGLGLPTVSMGLLAVTMPPAHALAIVIVPMVIITLSRGLRGRYDRHRAIARWTWPLWMYVSVTGVLVYFMLYQWFPHS